MIPSRSDSESTCGDQGGWSPNALTPLDELADSIDDLTKFAADRLGRPCLAVATAASMDGSSASEASITSRGSEQMFDCPVPGRAPVQPSLGHAAPHPRRGS